MIDNSELLEHWTELFIGYLNGTLSESEAAEFEELTRDPHFAALRERLTTSGYIADRMAEYDAFDAHGAFGRFRTAAGLGKPAGTLRRWAVAATGIAAAVVIAAGIAFLTHPQPDERERTLQLADAIYPAPDKVTLTLADGRKLQLDEQAEKQIEGVGRISYGTEGVKYEAAPEVAEQAGEVPLYNELSVPEGSKCLVTLEDGTRVWLNARSTLRYPVKFTAGERRVELSGEGLFDVTHNPERPFIVEADKATMTVRRYEIQRPRLQRRGHGQHHPAGRVCRGRQPERHGDSRAGHAVPDARRSRGARRARGRPHGLHRMDRGQDRLLQRRPGGGSCRHPPLVPGGDAGQRRSRAVRADGKNPARFLAGAGDRPAGGHHPHLELVMPDEKTLIVNKKQ